jgi:hypothetical protein
LDQSVDDDAVWIRGLEDRENRPIVDEISLGIVPK